MRRGGSWHNDARNLATAVRIDYHATNRNDNVGFRVVSVPANTLTASHRAGTGPDAGNGVELPGPARSRRPFMGSSVRAGVFLAPMRAAEAADDAEGGAGRCGVAANRWSA